MAKHFLLLLFLFGFLAGPCGSLPAAASADSQIVLAKLKRPVSINAKDLTLKEVYAQIAAQVDVPMEIDWPAFEKYKANQDTKVSLQLTNVPADVAIDLVSVAGPYWWGGHDRLVFTIDQDKVLVTSNHKAELITETRHYSLEKYFGRIEDIEKDKRWFMRNLERLIVDCVGDPDEWLDQHSTIKEEDGRLTIKTRPRNHEALLKLFKQIRMPWPVNRDEQARADKLVAAKLKSIVILSEDKMTLREVFRLVEGKLESSVFVHWRNIDVVGVEPDTLVSTKKKRVSLEELLQDTLEQVSTEAYKDDKLAMTIHEGVLRVGMIRSIKRYRRLIVYNTSHKPSDRDATRALYKKIIEQVGDKNHWLDEDFIATSFYGRLVVRTTSEHHSEVRHIIK